jgi:hypothetical protein
MTTPVPLYAIECCYCLAVNFTLEYTIKLQDLWFDVNRQVNNHRVHLLHLLMLHAADSALHILSAQ